MILRNALYLLYERRYCIMRKFLLLILCAAAGAAVGCLLFKYFIGGTDGDYYLVSEKSIDI